MRARGVSRGWVVCGVKYHLQQHTVSLGDRLGFLRTVESTTLTSEVVECGLCERFVTFHSLHTVKETVSFDEVGVHVGEGPPSNVGFRPVYPHVYGSGG